MGAEVQFGVFWCKYSYSFEAPLASSNVYKMSIRMSPYKVREEMN